MDKLPVVKEALMSTNVLETREFAAADRCDRCGARAVLRVTLLNGGELLFCNHHAYAHEDKLKQVALQFQRKD